MRRAPYLLATAFASLALGLAACGDEEEPATPAGETEATPSATAEASGQITSNPDNAKITLTIGSKNFTEQKVLGEIYAQGLAAAGYTTKTDLNLGDQDAALAALKAGEISAYPEYTGTALTVFFGKDAADLPKDPQAAYEEAKADFEKEGLTAFPPTPFTSSNEVAVTKETADKYGLKNISDLSKVADQLTLYGTSECRKRMDCLLGLEEVYGLKFKKFTPVSPDQRHEVLQSSRADVSIVYTTDPQIKRNNEVLLEDDKGMFPPYNPVLVMKAETAEQAGPDLAKTIDLIQKPLTDDAMQELDARVDLDKKEPADVAKEYLSETGLVK
ncbi:osmoprotectant transport system substrate-binding protein [Solirubrobacter pauli]|uniref:Osmoprotectant transport system substrate-binding protein n=1 Tax=Solirubrobacter pauli TaxID=166793 RepID=A0A660L2A2_9ACTN|nr:glycine betaine ABC transporter substrate-binding protein [Solirubrobacter pauli]RKQ87435.1 osmoprotectant transport system substrate-binding protein [Solirubrobacter pauli]